MRNSTIKNKHGECPLCKNGKEVALVKGVCVSHYWLGVRMKSAQKQTIKDDSKDDVGLSILKKELDEVFSQWIRKSSANSNGICICYICGGEDHWTNMDAGHFIKRGNSFLRYDPRNVKVNCKTCNQFKGGNLVQFAIMLEKESPGIVEYLTEESNIVYKFTRHELRSMLTEYTKKLSQLKNK